MPVWLRFQATHNRRAWVRREAITAVVEQGGGQVSLYLTSDQSEVALFVDEPIEKVLEKIGIPNPAPQLVRETR